jgi:hypothetical protein
MSLSILVVLPAFIVDGNKTVKQNLLNLLSEEKKKKDKNITPEATEREPN